MKLTCGILSAFSAICCIFVDTVSSVSFVTSSVSTQQFYDSGIPLAFAGSLGMVPLPHQYYEDTKTSHSPSFSFEYSEKYHLTGFSLRPSRSYLLSDKIRCPKGRDLICIPLCSPVAVLFLRWSYEISQVPDQPYPVSALLVDPDRVVPPDHTEVQYCSCLYDDKSSSIGQFRGSGTRLLQSLSTLHALVTLHVHDSLPIGGQPLSGEVSCSPG